MKTGVNFIRLDNSSKTNRNNNNNGDFMANNDSNTNLAINYNYWADVWYYDVGVNVIPANTKEKGTFENWLPWQDKSIPQELHEQRKKNGEYNKGIAIIPGKIWRGQFKGKYFVAIDLDNKKAKEEFCRNSLEKLKQKTLVEQHADPNKMHIYFIVEREIPNKASDKTNTETIQKINANEIPALEVKGNSKGIMFCSPSPHGNGSNRMIVGTLNPEVYEAQKVEDRIFMICKKYDIPYGSNNNSSAVKSYQIPIEDLWKPETKILKGHNRHLELLRIMESLLQNNRKMSLEDIKQMAQIWNQNHCEPPLDNKEFEKQWKCALKFIKRMETQNLNNNTNNNLLKNNQSQNITKNQIDIRELETELEQHQQIPDKNYFKYIVKSIKKTVKCEDSLIRQILYTGLSTYIQNDPINLGIIAPTSEGKTYPLEECLQYFPKEDVYKVGSMSTMALVREKGILVDKNGDPLGERISNLRKQKERTKDKQEKERITEEIKLLYEDAKTLIDLRGKILVFLEPPQHELWTILKPILSHDSYDIEFPFVDKNDRDGLYTKKVVVRGWPSCIFCSAKDESNWSMWPEIKSRFLISSPNMIPQKYKQSIKLISQKSGFPISVQEKIIISNEEIEITKKCIQLLKQKIIQLRNTVTTNGNGKISLWIPYHELLSKELPSNKGTDVRFGKRVFSFLNIIPIVHQHLRMKLVLGDEISIIANIEDLREALTITQNFDGIPKYKIEFFNNIFYSCYKAKKGIPDSNKDNTKQEDRDAVTARQLCDAFKKVKGKSITTDNLKKTYLDELMSNGLIDYDKSNIDAKQYIYYPIADPLSSIIAADEQDESLSLLSNSDQFDKVSQYSSTIYEKITRNINETWLFYEIMGLLQYRIDFTNIKGPLADYLNNHTEFQLLDNNNSCCSSIIEKKEEKEPLTSGDNTKTILNSEKEKEHCCCSNNNTSDRITIRQFTKKYIENSQTRFDIKQGSNVASFDKISPIKSNLAKFDNKDMIEYGNRTTTQLTEEKNNNNCNNKTDGGNSEYKKEYTNDDSSSYFSLDYLDHDQRERIEHHLKDGKTLKCHHDNCYEAEFSSLQEYNKHCHKKHPK